MSVQRELELLVAAARPSPVLREAVLAVERYVWDTDEIVAAARDIEQRVVSGDGFDLGEIFNSAGRLRRALAARDARERIEASVKRNRPILDKLTEGDDGGIGAQVSEGDPGEVLPPQSHAERQAGLNGPSGSPTSPSERDPEQGCEYHRPVHVNGCRACEAVAGPQPWGPHHPSYDEMGQ